MYDIKPTKNVSCETKLYTVSYETNMYYYSFGLITIACFNTVDKPLKITLVIRLILDPNQAAHETEYQNAAVELMTMD